MLGNEISKSGLLAAFSDTARRLSVAVWIVLGVPVGISLLGGILKFGGLGASRLSTDARDGRDATEIRGARNCAGDVSPKRSDGQTWVSDLGRSGKFRASVCIGKIYQNLWISPEYSDSILTWDEATEFGLKPNRLTYDHSVTMPFGVVKTALVRVERIIVGDVIINDVAVMVARDHELGAGFLGRNFLSRLKSFKIADRDTLVMTPHMTTRGRN